MKRRIEYESKMVLPDEILKAFREAEKRICEHEYERDKLIIDLSQLRFDCMKWFSNHETILKEEAL
jgi:hypothetical protein